MLLVHLYNLFSNLTDKIAENPNFGSFEKPTDAMWIKKKLEMYHHLCFQFFPSQRFFVFLQIDSLNSVM